MFGGSIDTDRVKISDRNGFNVEEKIDSVEIFEQVETYLIRYATHLRILCPRRHPSPSLHHSSSFFAPAEKKQ